MDLFKAITIRFARTLFYLTLTTLGLWLVVWPRSEPYTHGVVWYVLSWIAFPIGLMLCVYMFARLTIAIMFPDWKQKPGRVDEQSESIEQEIAALDAHTGKLGRVTAALRPTGTIELEGGRWPARSDGLFVEAGTAVRVVARYRDVLLVKVEAE